MKPSTHRLSPRFAACERGDTLIELIIVMIILLVIIGAFADGFASVSKNEIDQTNRASDQQSARQALDRMRLDIHCATSVTGGGAQPIDASNPSSGYVIVLNETPSPAGATSGCPGVTTSGSAVQWCTSELTPTRYQLYRSAPGECTPTTASFQVDYIAPNANTLNGNIWPTTTCASGEYPTVAVDMPVNRDPTTQPGRAYELKDSIAMRNSVPCS